jgi:hypothetical protein
VLVAIVDHAPRITRVGVAALHFPMRGVAVHKAQDLRPLFVSPFVAVPWRELIHAGKTAVASAGSEAFASTSETIVGLRSMWTKFFGGQSQPICPWNNLLELVTTSEQRRRWVWKSHPRSSPAQIRSSNDPPTTRPEKRSRHPGRCGVRPGCGTHQRPCGLYWTSLHVGRTGVMFGGGEPAMPKAAVGLALALRRIPMEETELESHNVSVGR